MKEIIKLFSVAILGGLVVFTGIKLTEKPENINPQNHSTQSSSNTSTQVKSQFTNYYPDVIANTDFRVAAKNSVNSVVHVRTVFESKTTYYNDPFMEFFFGKGTLEQRSPQREGQGSGVIISDNGYIITNNHVINGGDKVEVTLNNRKKYQAKVVGTDPTTDIALLKIEDENLPFMNYGNSDNLEVGEWVLAVGNPFNLRSTVTAGIVSAKGRDIGILNRNQKNGLPAIESFIQTDAVVNPGNSGGALVNTNGELIGINTAIQSNTGSYTGYSFAVPVNIVKKVVNDISEFGTVQRAFIGVSIRPIDEELAEEENLKDLNGIYIAGVTDNGGAEDAGLEKGDVIKKVGAVEVKNIPELQEQLSKFRPGDNVMITVMRGNEEVEKSVTLKNRFGNTEVINKKESVYLTDLGVQLDEVNSELKDKLNISGGLQVTTLTPGKLKRAGIEEGFIITKIDDKAIKSKQDFESSIDGKKGGVLIEGIYPNGLKAYYGLGL